MCIIAWWAEKAGIDHPAVREIAFRPNAAVIIRKEQEETGEKSTSQTKHNRTRMRKNIGRNRPARFRR